MKEKSLKNQNGQWRLLYIIIIIIIIIGGERVCVIIISSTMEVRGGVMN